MKMSRLTFITLLIFFSTLNNLFSQKNKNNPMGKTWVVFIENSKYQTFASLDGPVQDVSLMRSSLANYQIDSILHKKDLTKKEIENFIRIELKNIVQTYHVNSLLFWYAGHGKFIYETGYWVPVDAKRDDETTYFNTNILKESLQKFANDVTHILVVTDACESGPTFYQAMRTINENISCSDLKASQSKSSQVFSSTGYEIATDESQFTKTFASTLKNNTASCISIETIVAKVITAVVRNNQQKPKFGKITGLSDENGTFFFISK
jgi:uncharacterized caspase-like protein